MTYNPNIPQATDNPSTSQGQILSNFQQLNDQFGTDLTTGNGGDHILFSSTINNGAHNRVKFLDQSGASTPVKQAGPNQILFYGKTNSGVTMPYYTRDNIPLNPAMGPSNEWPVSPIKAYASFTTVAATGTSVIVPDDAFNILSITQVYGNPTTYTIVMVNACRTNTYGITYSLGLSNLSSLTAAINGYTITNTTTFVINVAFGFLISTPPAIHMTFTILET